MSPKDENGGKNGGTTGPAVKSPKRNTTQSVLAQTVEQMVMIINPAPLLSEERQKDFDGAHRGNTPWYINFPTLGITFEVIDPKTQEPVIGYYPDKQAESDALAMWNHIRKLSPAERDALRESSPPMNLFEGFKAMIRRLRVEPLA